MSMIWRSFIANISRSRARIMVAKIFSAAHISNIPVRLDSIARNATLVIGRYPNRKFHAGNVEFLDSSFKCNTCIEIGCCDEEKLQPPE
ncbi:hypothetical protein, partial [Burkholderia ubonensis]|uniref:hypothetical protein n=1 Tax=Burkholderia ubonensis TaxID=101571 RepID=UPI001E4FF264